MQNTWCLLGQKDGGAVAAGNFENRFERFLLKGGKSLNQFRDLLIEENASIARRCVAASAQF